MVMLASTLNVFFFSERNQSRFDFTLTTVMKHLHVWALFPCFFAAWDQGLRQSTIVNV